MTQEEDDGPKARLGCQAKEIGCCGDILWSTAGTEGDVLNCMHMKKREPTEQHHGALMPFSGAL